jgi:hypothetical protein
MFRLPCMVTICLLSFGSVGWSQPINLGDTFCGANGSDCFDSNWVPTTNVPNHTLPIPHTLGKAPRFINIYFSPTGDSSNMMPVLWPWSATASGNPVSISVTDSQILLEICACAPLHGYWSANNGQWVTYSSGSFRVIAHR